MYLANTAVLDILHSTVSITSDYGFLLWFVNIFTIDTNEYYPMCDKINDAKTFKNLGYYFTVCAHKSSYVYCRMAHLTVAFKIILI